MFADSTKLYVKAGNGGDGGDRGAVRCREGGTKGGAVHAGKRSEAGETIYREIR